MILLSFSCTKLIDMPVSNGPVFETQMEISIFQNNQWVVVDSIVIAAGDDDSYYNSYSEERNGVMVYVGEFSFENDTKKLKFEYYDHANPYSMAQGVPLLNNETSFSDFTSAYTGYLSLDSSQLMGAMTDWQWTVDGTPNNDWIHTISEPGVYDIKLDVEFDGQTVSSLSNQVYLGFENPTWGYFETIDLGSGDFEFVSHVQHADAIIQWEVDGSVVSTGATCLYYLSQGVHKVKMLVSEPGGNNYSREKNIGHNSANYVQSFNFVKPIGKDLYNTLIVSYESDGEVYSSKHANQLNPLINIGEENHLMETAHDLIVQYPVDLNFDMINMDNFQLLKVNMTGKVGFLVEK